MKIWELANGLQTPLTEEENDLLLIMIEDETQELDEREEIIAQSLVSKSILTRVDEDDDYSFKVNYQIDSWRD